MIEYFTIFRIHGILKQFWNVVWRDKSFEFAREVMYFICANPTVLKDVIGIAALAGDGVGPLVGEVARGE
jgi:hypothetical protein